MRSRVNRRWVLVKRPVGEPGDDCFAREEHPVRETIADSIEMAPSAFRGMLARRNFGKQLVRLATPD